MDDELIERITREVMQQLQSGPSEPPHRPPTERVTEASPPAHPLVILTGGKENFDEVKKQLQIIGEKSPRVTIVMTPSAEQVIGKEQVQKTIPRASIITGKFTKIGPLLKAVDIIYVPILTLNTASKVASMSTDNLATILIVFGLMRGKRVVAAVDSVYCGDIIPSVIPERVRGRIDSILAQLKELGIFLVPISHLTEGSILSHISSTSSYSTTYVTPSTAPPGTSNPAFSGKSTCGKDNSNCSGCGRCVVSRSRYRDAKRIIDAGADRISALGVQIPQHELSTLIDHTLLRPNATEEEIVKLCEEAKKYNFATVCINPSWVPLCAKLLKDRPDVKVCTVVGFPLGATTTSTKVAETKEAIANGADEIDMVINVGALKSGNDDLVFRDIKSVEEACHSQRKILKVIIEAALLTDEEKVRASKLTKKAGADFVKTSTGFGPGGATVNDVALMRETVGPEMGIKAAGGIRTREAALAMVDAGATRIGASASIAIAS